MENISDIKQSIEISKPIIISSFWNLFSKNDKKQHLQNVSNTDTSKVNDVIMKVLKSKGIDFKNLEDFDINDNQTSKQNKIVTGIINQNQENFSKENLAKKNILFKLLKNKNNLKTVDGFKASFTPPSDVSVKTEKGVVSFSMTFLKSKRTKGNDVKKKKGIKVNEKDNRTFNMLSSTIGLSQKVLFKAVPQAKLKNSKRKRVMVPVYIGNKTSSKSSNSKNENLSDRNGKDGAFVGPSLVGKIKTVEEQLNELKCKSNKKRDTSCKTFLDINQLHPSSNKRSKDFQLMASTLVSNKAKRNNSNSTKLQTDKKSKENNLTKENVGKRHGSRPKILMKDCPGHDATKSGKTSKQRIGSFDDMLYNPDVLIKNHKLIIPRDISEGSLFQANPYAGCDTVLKLFKALSQENGSSNQPKYILPKKNKEGHEEGRKTRECHIENTNKVKTVLTCESEISNRTTTNKSSTTTSTSSNRNIGSDCSIRYKNELRNIFSLPMNLNILKSSEHSQSEEKRVLFEPTNSKLEKITKFPNENKGSCCSKKGTLIKNCYKEETPCHLEYATSQRKTSIQILSENLEKECKSKEILKDTSLIINNSKSCESGLNNIDIIENKNSLSPALNNSSTDSKEEMADVSHHKISIGTSSERSIHSNNRLELNISHDELGVSETVKQSQKLFKKTTISCPLESPEQKVSITILIENDLQNRKRLSSNLNIETPSLTQFREIQHLESSRDLKQLNSGKGKCTSKEKLQVPEQEEVSCASFSLTYTKPTVFKTSYIDEANKKSILKQNEVKILNFGLTSNKPYLTQKDRKFFDEEVLGVDHYEKSINLANLKFEKTNKEKLSDVNYRPGLVNILNEPSTDSEEADSCNQSKLNTLGNRKILYRFGKCLTRNPFYTTERLSNLKSQSRNKITQGNNYFWNYTKQVNVPEICHSVNQIDLPLVPNNANEFMITCNQQLLLKPQMKNYVVSTECVEDLNPVDVKGKSCRFSLVLNQQPFLQQRENSFLFPKTSQSDQIEKVQAVGIEQNHNNKEFFWLSSTTDTMRLNDGFEMFRACDTNPTITDYSSQQNNHSKMHVQTNLNTVKNSQIPFLSNNSKLNTTSDKTNSTIAERSLENSLSTASDTKRTNFEKPLRNFQYKKVGNRIHSICFSNSANKLIQDKCEHFQHRKRMNSEILLCTHAFEIPENFRRNENFDILVKSEPQLFSFTTIKDPASQNILNKTNQEISEIDIIDEQINQNNIKNICNCCNTGCLTVVSEEDLMDFYVTE